MSEKVLWVNTQFRDEEIDEFQRVQRFFGIRARADVVRHLVHNQARTIRVDKPPSTEKRIQVENG